jgi:MFS family permease
MFMGFYFITSWTPKLLVDAGWTIQQSILANIIINAGGVIAGLGFGFISQHIGYRWAIRIVLIFSSVFFVLFGLFGSDWSLRFILPLFMGFFLYGALISQYALLPRIYETAIRNTGTGWASGVGRLGAIAGPYLAGQLLASGWDGFNLYFLYAGCFIGSLIAVSMIWMKIDSEEIA